MGGNQRKRKKQSGNVLCRGKEKETSGIAKPEKKYNLRKHASSGETRSDPKFSSGIYINRKELRKDWIIDLYNWCTSDASGLTYYDEVFYGRVDFPDYCSAWKCLQKDLGIEDYKKKVYQLMFQDGLDPVIVVSEVEE